jgi:2-polyprenyl-6-hydroxyphenyl methylase/3-demethylubiquinone-9 3-methyltransferase
MKPRLVPFPVRTRDDIVGFFDRLAERPAERHGRPDRLLAYRLDIVRRHAGFRPGDVVLDIGCGHGHHLLALDGAFKHGIGIDLSPGMIEAARHEAGTTRTSRFTFLCGDAETLAPIPDASVDVALCIGALEHMIDQAAVFRAVRRVLRHGGRFVALTLNDEWIWYRHLAPKRGYETRHLDTDRRLDASGASALMVGAGFADAQVDAWTFIPAGDMPARYRWLLAALDWPGRWFRIRALRGGLVLTAAAPISGPAPA